MARTLAALPAGSRITDYISLGVVARFFPAEKVKKVLRDTGRASVRERDLPAHVAVYYVIALALYMHSSYGEVLRCLLEGIQWLLEPSAKIKVTGSSGISQARTRLGWEPLRQLHDDVVKPIAVKATRGAWYAGWRLVSLDGSTLDELTRRAMTKPLAVRAPVAARVRIRKSASCHWPKWARMFCSARRWMVIRSARSRCQKKYYPASQKACCVWPTATSSGSRCGRRRLTRVPICYGV